jgi:uncharacterized membrane protein YdjX (TVP38/TMEM64 family)
MTRRARSTCRLLLKGSLLFLSMTAVILLVRTLDFTDLDAAWVDRHIRSRGFAGILFFLAVTACVSALGFPRQALSFLGGYAFGAVPGTLWTTLGTTAGCVLSFSYARLLGRSLIMRFFEPRMRRLNVFLARSPFAMTLVIRCLPVGNNTVTSLLGGLSSIPALPFIAGSFVGYIPQNLIFAVLGSGMRVDPFWRILLSAALFVLSSVLGYMLHRRHMVAQLLENNKEGGE